MSVVIVGGRGYIGSRLSPLIPDALIVDPIDGLSLRDAAPVLAGADAVIYLAGHSGRDICRRDHVGAAQGVADFVWLCSVVKKTCKIVYASSASVYYGSGPDPVTEQHPVVASDVYTWTKLAIEEYARVSSLETYGLRLGAVAGWSPNFRMDTVLNGMAWSAIQDRKVIVTNEGNYRPVLGILDCCAAILAVLNSESDRRGVYNVASFNTTIGRLGTQIAAGFGVTLEYGDECDEADFCVSTAKFHRVFGLVFGDTVSAIVGEIAERISADQRQLANRCAVHADQIRAAPR